jgi:glycosyltransferase involved in cell wall biosynthesis
MMPYFTIIIPSFNRVHVIDRAIQSILNQTYPDWELIIVDDGSTDNTKEILTSILADKRIKYIYQDNAGVCAARNKGVSLATGKYLVFLDSDDNVLITWLEDFYRVKDFKYDMIFCNMKIIKPDKTIKLVSCLDPYNNGNSKGISIPGTWSIRKDIFIASGMYDEKIKYGENTELRLRFNEEMLKIGLIDKYNFIYNESLNGGSKNHQNKIDSILYVLDKHKEHYNNKKHVKKVFLQTAAVSAVRIQQTKKANDLFKLALSENKTNVKLWLQCFFTTSDFLANLTWPKS